MSQYMYTHAYTASRAHTYILIRLG